MPSRRLTPPSFNQVYGAYRIASAVHYWQKVREVDKSYGRESPKYWQPDSKISERSLRYLPEHLQAAYRRYKEQMEMPVK